MNLKNISIGAALALSSMISGTALAGTATFTGASGYPQSYSEAGITFTSLSTHVHLGDFAPDTIADHNGGCCTDPILITQTGGGAFTLNSMLIVQDSGPTTFTGSNAAVYTVTGPGFVNFGSLFAGVTDVTWHTDYSGYSVIDDVTTTAVPEPETYAMMLAGLGLLGFATRRKLKAVAAT